MYIFNRDWCYFVKSDVYCNEYSKAVGNIHIYRHLYNERRRRKFLSFIDTVCSEIGRLGNRLGILRDWDWGLGRKQASDWGLDTLPAQGPRGHISILSPGALPMFWGSYEIFAPYVVHIVPHQYIRCMYCVGMVGWCYLLFSVLHKI